MSAIHTSAFSRRENARALPTTTLEKIEGAGNAGCALHPQSRVQKVKSTRGSHHRFTGAARHSPRNGFNGFLRALPGDRACLPPSFSGSLRQLDASVGASEPHDFAVRLGAVRQKHHYVHRIPPRVRDDRETPLIRSRTCSLYYCFYHSVKR